MDAEEASISGFTILGLRFATTDFPSHRKTLRTSLRVSLFAHPKRHPLLLGCGKARPRRFAKKCLADIRAVIF